MPKGSSSYSSPRRDAASSSLESPGGSSSLEASGGKPRRRISSRELRKNEEKEKKRRNHCFQQKASRAREWQISKNPHHPSKLGRKRIDSSSVEFSSTSSYGSVSKSSSDSSTGKSSISSSENSSDSFSTSSLSSSSGSFATSSFPSSTDSYSGSSDKSYSGSSTESSGSSPRRDAEASSRRDAKASSRRDPKASSRRDPKASSRRDAKASSRRDAKASSRRDAKASPKPLRKSLRDFCEESLRESRGKRSRVPREERAAAPSPWKQFKVSDTESSSQSARGNSFSSSPNNSFRKSQSSAQVQRNTARHASPAGETRKHSPKLEQKSDVRRLSIPEGKISDASSSTISLPLFEKKRRGGGGSEGSESSERYSLTGKYKTAKSKATENETSNKEGIKMVLKRIPGRRRAILVPENEDTLQKMSDQDSVCYSSSSYLFDSSEETESSSVAETECSPSNLRGLSIGSGGGIRTRPGTASEPEKNFFAPRIIFSTYYSKKKDARYSLRLCGEHPLLGGSLNPEAALKRSIKLLDTKEDSSQHKDYFQSKPVQFDQMSIGRTIRYTYFVVKITKPDKRTKRVTIFETEKNIVKGKRLGKIFRSFTVPPVEIRRDMTGEEAEQQSLFILSDARFNDISRPNSLSVFKDARWSESSDAGI